MKTPLGTEVDLGPGHNVLDGDPAPRWKGHSSPHSPLFSPCLLWPRSPIAGTAELLFKLTVAKTMVLLLTIGGYEAHPYAYFFRPGSVLKPKSKPCFGGKPNLNRNFSSDGGPSRFWGRTGL